MANVILISKLLSVCSVSCELYSCSHVSLSMSSSYVAVSFFFPFFAEHLSRVMDSIKKDFGLECSLVEFKEAENPFKVVKIEYSI